MEPGGPVLEAVGVGKVADGEGARLTLPLGDVAAGVHRIQGKLIGAREAEVQPVGAPSATVGHRGGDQRVLALERRVEVRPAVGGGPGRSDRPVVVADDSPPLRLRPEADAQRRGEGGLLEAAVRLGVVGGGPLPAAVKLPVTRDFQRASSTPCAITAASSSEYAKSSSSR